MNGYETTPEFQSTPPRGWRLLTAKYEFVLLHISIHSTARVETKVMAIVLWSDANFNPLHREGGDSDADMGVDGTSDFNPLHREGGDAGQAPRTTS